MRRKNYEKTSKKHGKARAQDKDGKACRSSFAGKEDAQTTVRSAPKKSAEKTKQAVPAKQARGFAGASEVSVTENKIIVTREVSENRRGRYQRSEVRDYLDKTPSNMAALNSKLKNTAVKKITVKFKR